ncbi:MAG: histidine phosphatase family protein [Chloroflexi bacterium]|nr:histidine phosphatase family protein [Chloroflexota bacterium]
MTRLLIVRHGETAWNDQARYQGHTDVPLSPRGWSEAECLARRLANESIDAIYASDLTRAGDTARVIASRLGITPVVEPQLREIRLGEWQGLSYAEVRRRYFTERDPLPVYPVDSPPRGGECLRELQARLVAAVERIAARHPEQCVLVVTHGACLKVLLCAWLKIELASHARLRFDSGSITEVYLHPYGVAVTRVNDTMHLREKVIA